MLLIAPSTFYTLAVIRRDFDLASNRVKPDAEFRLEVQRVRDDNFEVYEEHIEDALSANQPSGDTYYTIVGLVLPMLAPIN